MITVIAVIVYAVLAFVCAILYIPKFKQIFYFKHKLEHKTATKKRKISITIPARDEGEVIGDLFSSIAEQDYDKQFFCVNVIVNSPDDPTVEMAEAYGFKTFVIENQKCKGDALDGYFKAEDKPAFESFDAFVIVDADAVLAPDYVSELNNALEYDAQIFLSRKHIKNFFGTRKDRTVFSNCSALTYAQLDDLGNVYRTKHNMPLNMCGQGMMIRRETIEELGGWPYRTLTEDYEMRMDCYLHGFKSIYYPYAIICTEEPLKHKENFDRRMRWVTGFSQSDRIYKKRIKQQIKERGKATAGEREFFSGLVPIIFFLVLTFATMLTGVALSVYGGVTGEFDWLFSLLLLIVMPFAVLYLILIIYAILCMTSMSDAFARVPLSERIAAILYEPFYALEYLPIYLSSKVKASRGWDWKPTRHIRYKGGLSKNCKREKNKKEEKSGAAAEELN